MENNLQGSDAGYLFPHGCIVVMVKAPRLGQVKTRMQPVLLPAQSLALHCDLAYDIIERLQRYQLAPVILQISDQHEFFDQFPLPKRLQRGDDLGVRMAHAAQQALNDVDWVVLVGADCPFLDKDYLSAAMQLLQKGEQAVVGPASDGGYVLLGLHAVHDDLFSNMSWGAETVFAETSKRLNNLAWRWQSMPIRDDIDRVEDLKKLHNHPRLAAWAVIENKN
jgi:rSAM/selenodomain-associated transferase 1